MRKGTYDANIHLGRYLGRMPSDQAKPKFSLYSTFEVITSKLFAHLDEEWDSIAYTEYPQLRCPAYSGMVSEIIQ